MFNLLSFSHARRGGDIIESAAVPGLKDDESRSTVNVNSMG